MAEIMNKARINYYSLKIVDDISVELKQETRTFFDKLISDFRINDSSENNGKLKIIFVLAREREREILPIVHLIFNVNNYYF